jgi:hypothetical protein
MMLVCLILYALFPVYNALVFELANEQKLQMQKLLHPKPNASAPVQAAQL